MKLIIDIPTDTYNILMKHKGLYTNTTIFSAVINGIPYEERQQGNWKDHSEDGYVECPICNCLTNCDDNIDELHYCWNCGANMKGDKE